MATEKEANKAREAHSDFLRKSGAHAILVDKVKSSQSKDTFGVVAFYEELPDELPDDLEIEIHGKKKKVPLKGKVIPMATLE
ncbi:MAG TPA: hypothetical protein VJ464_01445 [Blastocatellia bacterium]|nr:hypothetical protein [Blastocatellia bacterium]